MGIRLRPYHVRRASRRNADAPSPSLIPPVMPIATAAQHVFPPPSLAPSHQAINRKRLAEKQGARPQFSVLGQCLEHRNRGFALSEFCNRCDKIAEHAVNQEALRVSLGNTIDVTTSYSDDDMNSHGLVPKSPEKQFWGDPVARSSCSDVAVIEAIVSSTSYMHKYENKNKQEPPCKGLCSKTGWTIDQFCVFCHDS